MSNAHKKLNILFITDHSNTGMCFHSYLQSNFNLMVIVAHLNSFERSRCIIACFDVSACVKIPIISFELLLDIYTPIKMQKQSIKHHIVL